MDGNDAGGRLERIDGSNWDEFVNAPMAVLMLAKSGCPACAAWTEELSAALDGDPGFFRSVRFGKMILDEGGLADFERTHRWMATEVKDLPFTVIFAGGGRLRSFAGGGLDRLAGRLRSIEAEGGPPPE
jgi:hypothetical protein